MRSLKPKPSRVLVLLAAFALAGIPAKASEDSFVVAVGARNELLSGAGSGYNAGQWYSYPTGWHSQWFNNSPYDAGRKMATQLRLSVEPLDSALPSRVIITYGWSTPEWSALGRATPPLPGASPEGTYIQRHVAFQGYLPAGAKPIRVEDNYEIRQYNPQWLSVDVQGENFVITDGWIKHESMPRTAGDVMLLQQQQPEACCFQDGHCENLTPSACRAKLGVPQGPGTQCLGDKNYNKVDDACEQQAVQCAPRADGQGCLQVTCPNTGDQCVPTKIRVRYTPGAPPTYTVLSCACQSPNLCHVAISSSGSVYCTGGCPTGQQCQTWATYNLDGTIDYECRCGAQPTEACCLPNGECVNTDPQTCQQRGGEPQGTGTKCLGDLNGNGIDDACEEPTPETVACCLPDGQCVDLKPDQCMGRGGTPLAPGSQCSTPQACCLPDGTCIMTDPQCCRKAGGTPQSPNIDCKNVNCPQPLEACCLPDGTCTDTTANDCRAKGGTPQGPGTNCKTVKCGAVENDTFGFAGRIELDVPGLGLARPLMSGQATQRVYFEGDIGRANDDDGNGRDEVQTELLQLSLTGVDPLVGNVKVGLHPTKPSLGQMEERVNNTPGLLDVPPFTPTGTADSFFDVFFEVELPDVGLTLYGQLPKRLLAVLTRKNHGLCDTYQNGEQTPLVDANGNVRGFLGPVRISINGPCEACCLSDGTCIYTTKDDCTNRGGTAQGEGTDCSTVSCLPPGECEWNAGDPHKMHFPQLPDPQGWDVEVPPTDVADDWKCSETGPVTDIHFWYSWQGDNVGIIDRIHASIYSNNPAGDSAYGYSTPGQLLWEGVFGPADFDLRHWATGDQGFMNWRINFQGWIMGYHTWRPNDHKDIYQCNLCNITDPFTQQAGQIYWLVLSITIRDPVGTHIGWKTSLDHFEDDAVYWGAPTGIWHWRELRDPQTEKSLDLAFVITGREVPPPPQACCLPDGTCQNLTPTECREKGGVPQGPGTDCTTVNCLPTGGCEWSTGDPHKMHFPQLPDLQGWDVDVTAANLLADDWKCSETGPVTDIHFWYSWQGDKVGIIDRVHASIYSNIPAGESATGYSIPGKLLWEGVFGPADCNLRHWATGDQGFIMGGQGKPNDHKNIYQCNICNIPYPFIQQAGQIYWLVLSITIRDPVGTHIGWKTSLDHFEDDAVYDAGGRWVELRDPRTMFSLDLAFVITGQVVPEPGIKWAQRPEVALCNMLPGCFFGWDELSIFAGSQIVADDWLCTDDRPITDIHWWGSFKGWASQVPPPQMPDGFHITIWTDVPAVSGTTGFSHPGKAIWQTYCKDYTYKFVGWDVDPHDMAPPWEATFYFEYDLPEAEWFWQDPSAHIYWVSIAAQYAACPCNADFDGDGDVDLQDFTIFQGCYTQPPVGSCAPCDLDCDGDIDLDDFRIFQCQFKGPNQPPNSGCCPSQPSIGYPWGWKTRRRDPASAAPDDAVIILKPTSPAVGDTFQAGEPIYWPTPDRSWDMAFVLTTAGAIPECDWNAGDPHKMHWPQPPDLSDKGVDVDLLAGLADDFKCTATGPIKDIHFWGSFADDILPAGGPGSLAVKITVHADIPATTAKPWSTPGEVLWSRTFGPGEYTVRQVHEGPEDWYDPATGLYQKANHKNAYQYNFCIEVDPFVQQEGKVYWLAIKDIAPVNAGYTFGWKTTAREHRWNDDAAFLHPNSGWLPMTYPDGHAFKGETLDLAFVITGGEEAKAEYDLGDAPDSSNSFGVPMTAYPKGGPLGVQANFPTVYRAGSPPHGPIHHKPKAVAYLGDHVSLENEADIGPDEDGINNIVPVNDSPDLDITSTSVQVPLALPHCQQTRFKYKVTVVPLLIEPPPLYVNVWLDWNRDGDWDDVLPCPYPTVVPEWAVQNQLLQFVTSGTYDVTTPEFMCWHPPGTTAENPIWMRITLSERRWEGMVPSPVAGAGGDGPAAGYEFGETEDYYFVPQPLVPQYDFGDAPDPKYPTLLASNGARHLIGGPWMDTAGQPDPEPDGQADLGALGDDNNGSDDEDGVEIPPLIQGHTAALTLHVNGGGGSVQAWIDFDSDGIWRISERVYNGVLPNGTHIISVPVPADAAIGQTFARFRISSAGGLGPAGQAADGEVEDYLVDVKAPPPDIEWPQWPDLTRNGINIRVDTSDGKLRTIADDFKCTSYKKVIDVHLWGSWKYDRKGLIKRIHLSIHADDPTGAEGSDPQNRFSQPDQQVLWAKDFGPGQFTETLYHKLPFPGEWWWDPVTGQLIPGGDREVWQIDIYISAADAFQQKGSPDNPLIYWLDVQVDTENGQFGWKTRQWPEHYMDDAVWDVGSELPRLWKELRYPLGHPYYGLEKDSIDMAFVITGREEAPPPPPVAEHTKWSQPPIEIDPRAKTPIYCGWDEPAFAIRPSSTTTVLPTVWNMVADDFRCLGSMPVTSVHWWGSYQGWDGSGAPAVRPTFWRIGFWSNVPANPLAKPGHSYPKKLLWRVDVPANRVSEERAGFDRFANRGSDTCFRYYVKFEPQEYFWQQKYIDSATGDDVFWISITAIYPPVTIPFQQWGWETRPQHWMDDAVKFTVEDDLPLGYVNDLPLIFTPIEAALCGQQQSFDMAFELDTDPSYIKWEQAFTGIRNWMHYADEESLAFALATDDQKQQSQIRRLVADDWPCEQITPITAAVWWGSYIGYRYKACDCPLMAAPLKPDYFLLSIWTDVRPAANAPFSRPGEKIWEYRAENYDEVQVGYDKKPETLQPGQTPGYEPVFRYSVRLPRDKWFCQKDLNSIYWFSVVAVYAGDKTPVHPWGWTNHPRVDWQVSDPTVPPTIARNDDAVAGYLDTTGATDVWKWQELHDQTGVSTDMSFMLFTEPGCFPCTYSTYADWLALGKPNCWCEPPYGSGYQCDGDADGADSGGLTKYRVFTGDLNLIVANWKKKTGDATLNPCADIDHKDSGGITKYRVFTGDLARLVANWRKKDAQLPGDCPRPE